VRPNTCGAKEGATAAIAPTFALHAVSRTQLEANERTRERIEQAERVQCERAALRAYADGLREGFVLRGSERAADDPTQHALF
jgi:hypothetical protein